MYHQFGYADIAKEVNQDILNNLNNMVNLENTDPDRALLSEYAVQMKLEGFQMKRQDAWNVIEEGVAAIKQGKDPWSLEDWPIDQRRVIDAFRQIKREIDKKKVVIK